MKKKPIQDQLNVLWNAYITDIQMDVLNDTLTFKLKSLKDGIVQSRELTFVDVSAYYYVKDSLSYRFNFYDREKIEYLELTSIEYLEKGSAQMYMHVKEEQEWSKSYSSEANIVMEIWESVLLIEARKIRLDDHIIELKGH